MALQGLIESMEKLTALHGMLIELGKQKTSVLVHNEVEQLNRLVQQESQVVRQITEWNGKREAAVMEFLLHKGFRPSPNVTVSELTKLIFNAEEKQTVLNLQQLLLGRITELRQLNAVNQQLIEQSLAFIDYSLDVVLGPPEDEAVYRNPMQQNSRAKRNGYFDTRA
ncbi:flagellar protein FlgN [Paenibacillus sp. CC-CFT747]|nr:flagellar protein FlgN [Paenibacillus sp. CC-CFT747]